MSAPLALLSMAIATAVALTAGVYAAERRGRGGDAAVMAASQVRARDPQFLARHHAGGVFAVHLRIAPAGGFPGWSDPLRALSALVLPAVASGLVQAAILTRVTRSALVEALNEDFMRTARAKGVSRRSALWRHALPNALPPILTIMGLQFANLVAGAVVVENVFVLPGLGRLIVQSIANRDVLVVEDCVMGLAAFVIRSIFSSISPRRRSTRGSGRTRHEASALSSRSASLRIGMVIVGLLIADRRGFAPVDALSSGGARYPSSADAAVGCSTGSAPMRSGATSPQGSSPARASR